jgi:hypothetical protein
MLELHQCGYRNRRCLRFNRSRGIVNNDRIQVFELANELRVQIGDIQYALAKLKLPTRQRAVGWINGQHADVVRRGLRDGVWGPRARSEVHAARQMMTRSMAPAVRWLDLTCTCCQLPYRVQVPEGDPVPRVCGDCLGHQGAGEESAERVRWERQEDHLRRTLAWTGRLREKATEMYEEKQEAFQTRNRWRRAVVELVLAHGVGESESGDSGLCECGEPFPCSVRRLLASINPGVASQVERFEEMHPHQREKELNGERWTQEDEYRYQESLQWERDDDAMDPGDGDDLSAARPEGH